jgi:multidrug efflux pump subunit AcrA (membrane-fusion protein)
MNLKKSVRLMLVMAMFFLAIAGNALLADDNAAAPGAECPKKVAVVVEIVKPSIFRGYQYFSGQGQSEIVAVKSPVAGLISEIKVSEGSLVDAGQDLVVLNAGLNEDLKKFEAAVLKAKKSLAARKNWKDKSEQAIQSAEKDYQKALDLLNEKKAQTNLIVKAPVAGIVHLVKTAGNETAVDGVLLEIANPRQMVFRVSLTPADQGSFSVGDKFFMATNGMSAEIGAEVIAVSDREITFRVNNDSNKIKEGVSYTFMRMKGEYADIIAVPTTAIQKDSLGDFVYVAVKKTAKKMYVTLGDKGEGKTMVKTGLVAGTPCIVSGFECLVDGKKIVIVNQEELVETKAVEKKTQPVEPEVKVEEKKKEEKIESVEENRFRVGLTFERFIINDKNMREFYSNWFQHIPGLEVSYQALDKIDVWFAGKYFSLKQTTEFFGDQVKFTLLPFSLGLRYRPVKSGAFEPFVGAGINVYSYAEKITGTSGLENTSGLAFGFHFQGGTYIYFGDSFLRGIFSNHNRSLLGEIFVKYNIVNKTMAELLPDGTDKLNLSGLEMGIGLVVKF